jgi:hypothetical protein
MWDLGQFFSTNTDSALFMHHIVKTMRYAPCFLKFISISTGGVGITICSLLSSAVFLCVGLLAVSQECESCRCEK